MTSEKREVIIDAYEYIGKLLNGIDKMVNKFYEGNDKEGCEILAYASEGLEWLVKALELCGDEVDVKVEIEKLVESISESVQALENEDYILVGDIFNYEISSTLQEMKSVIEPFIK